uniref:20kDa-cement protein homologue n=1 Tax=Fistulobalanus albicostatus TaxID=1080442 RepID=A9CQM0_9CRUS|nr:20kDa-cement protein homologue [Fistulobalanus albicostatus]
MKYTLALLFLTAIIATFVAAHKHHDHGKSCSKSHPCYHCHTDCECNHHHDDCNRSHRCWHKVHGVVSGNCNCNLLTPCNQKHPCWRRHGKKHGLHRKFHGNACNCDRLVCNAKHPCWHKHCDCFC